ncbi:uncharacterized protein EI90DRAFT_3019857 [Cantharellus anzutake]|uniref:uncharacterized protein n=1 Tax=Cantharellus anzutake TaxID=1750568 RepID=UPI001905EC89|nr:uncharacterized protein EI90DRAFT_3019857 [Cantharellus anzutake]KAF8323501.1 hypothetical protein EI90DRAFT_3019857 [Cantharellus anzutake]
MSWDSLSDQLNLDRVALSTGGSDDHDRSSRHPLPPRHTEGRSAPRNSAPQDEEEQSGDEKWEDAQETIVLGKDDDVAASSSLDPEAKVAELWAWIDAADKLKEEGNKLFRESNWPQAIFHYEEGIRILPPRPVASTSQEKDRAPDDTGEELSPSPSAPEQASANPPEDNTRESEDEPLTLAEKQCSIIRSMLNSNIAACHVKMGNHPEAVASCTESLLDVPTYSKALHRRATSNEVIGTWTALSQADKDYKTLLETLPANSPLLPNVRIASRKLSPRLEQQQKKEMNEMLGKLKEVGNTMLGHFGLSTDNFQFTPNGQGGYSMNFVQK